MWQELARNKGIEFEVWYLSRQGAEISFDVEFKRSFAWDLPMLEGYPYRFLASNTNSDVSTFTGLRLSESLSDLLNRRNATALMIQGWQVIAYWQAVWEAQSVRVPVWVRGESNDLGQRSFFKSPLKRLALKTLFSRISKFLYIGTASRRFYKSFGIPDAHLHPAYYCVDNHRFQAQADSLRPQRQKIRDDWKIPSNAFCVLFAGKLISKKRPTDLVRAIQKLRSSTDRPLHILFAGSGDLDLSLRAECNVVFDAENSERQDDKRELPAASFPGFLNQQEISRAYVAADLLVLPSDSRETWGLVVNEAMASGLPCVASIECGCAEDLVLPFGRAGCFRVGDIEALSTAIQYRMNHPLALDDVRARIHGFSFAAATKTIIELYGSTFRR